MLSHWAYRSLVCALGATLGSTAANAQAANFTITDVFNFIQDLGNNDGNFRPGISDNFGIFVSPVGTQPTPSADGTSVLATQAGVQVPVPYFYSPANPTEFVNALPFPAYSFLTGSWAFTLSNPTINGGQPVSTYPGTSNPIQSQPLFTATPPPFVNNVLLTPNNNTPTLQWPGKTATHRTAN